MTFLRWTVWSTAGERLPIFLPCPFRATHDHGAEQGREHYGVRRAAGYDIAVCNTYGKANESAIAAGFAPMTLKPGGVGTARLDR